MGRLGSGGCVGHSCCEYKHHDDRKVKFLLENPEEYNKYHAWRSHYTGMEVTFNTETITNHKQRLINQTTINYNVSFKHTH